jgi:hypothetical protein
MRKIYEYRCVLCGLIDFGDLQEVRDPDTCAGLSTPSLDQHG